MAEMSSVDGVSGMDLSWTNPIIESNANNSSFCQLSCDFLLKGNGNLFFSFTK